MYYPTRCVWACKKKNSLPMPITDIYKKNIFSKMFKYWRFEPEIHLNFIPQKIYLLVYIEFVLKLFLVLHLKMNFKSFRLWKYNVSCLDIFQIILEAIPKDETDQARRYRGYIAVDDLYFESGDSCQGHCTFDSGMCGFLNAKGQDHFDWEVVRTF